MVGGGGAAGLRYEQVLVASANKGLGCRPVTNAGLSQQADSKTSLSCAVDWSLPPSGEFWWSLDLSEGCDDQVLGEGDEADVGGFLVTFDQGWWTASQRSPNPAECAEPVSPRLVVVVDRSTGPRSSIPVISEAIPDLLLSSGLSIEVQVAPRLPWAHNLIKYEVSHKRSKDRTTSDLY